MATHEFLISALKKRLEHLVDHMTPFLVSKICFYSRKVPFSIVYAKK